MTGLLPIGFAAPAVLAALALLPVIWWLLRMTPPRPRRVSFPPTRLLLDVAEREETPAKSPWWLTVLRLLLAAALIIALAGPVWQPEAEPAAGDGPVVLVVDNGWAAARDWPLRVAAAERALDRAERRGRPVVFAASAEGARQPVVADTAAAARTRLAALAPRPWPTDRAALIPAIETALAGARAGEAIWISDGLAGSDDLVATTLAELSGGSVMVADAEAAGPVGIAAIDNGADALEVAAVRLVTDGAPWSGRVDAFDGKGFVLGDAPLAFEPGAATATATFDLPAGLRNDIARLAVAGEDSAAAVRLVDDRWRRRSVGLIAGSSSDAAQPLLSPLHYLSRALAPFADVREPRGDLAQDVRTLVDEGTSVIVLADIGTIVDEARGPLADWVEKGGVLVRFAGPRLAAGTADLVPVKLRTGGRVLGGTLSWEEPQPLAAFSADGPFAGLAVPSEVTVNRQVLAEPDAALVQRTWASLGDGTPLVTAAPEGEGWIVLFHVTADTSWSNLPLSGTFVDMLRRVVALSSAAGNHASAAEVPLKPLRVLDGLGRLTAPGAEVEPLPPRAPLAGSVGPTRPPGLYGAEDAFQAVNLLPAETVLVPVDYAPLGGGLVRQPLVVEGPTPLKPYLLAAAMVLLILDAAVVLLLTGALRRRPIVTTAAALALAVVAAAAPRPAAAQDAGDGFALAATDKTHFAYVVTGDPTLDETSRLGLAALGRMLSERTALEPGDPVGVDPGRDELAFFPLLYWPLSDGQAKPSPEAMARIDAYMRNGGTILFDTRDQLSAGSNRTPDETLKLREILDGLDVPPLEPVPPDHVLTKAFYLLDDFPGRWSGGPLWVEATAPSGDDPGRPVRAGDGVSPILITGNDLAGAWALTEAGDWLYPTVPADPYQREYAFRAGINIVMYTLTGNYKADQVHVPALLERLGQ